MPEHIASILSSLHTRLTLLESTIHLTGRDIPPNQHTNHLKRESLQKLRQDLIDWRFRRQRQGLPVHNIYLDHPEIPTSPGVVAAFGTNEPLIYVPQELRVTVRKYFIICIFASEINDPLPYTIKYCLKSEHSSRDRLKARGGFIIESFKCRTAQEVHEALESMLFPTD